MSAAVYLEECLERNTFQAGEVSFIEDKRTPSSYARHQISELPIALKYKVQFSLYICIQEPGQLPGY